MTIYLLTQQEYDTLLEIQKKFPVLTFQNVGYQYIDRSKFTEEEKQADQQVTEILNAHIKDFCKFDNFKLRTNGDLVIRFQYQWDSSFTGVGYLKLSELLNGFEKPDETVTAEQ